MEIQAEMIAEINSRLKDEISKQIFMSRLLFSLTNDYAYMKNVVLTTNTGMQVYNKMRNCKSCIGIFGAGSIGGKILRMYSDIKFVCFIDNNKIGNYEGLPILSPTDFVKKYPDGIIVISIKEEHESVETQIKNMGLSNDQIINYGYEHVNMARGRQYFDLKQLWEIEYKKEVFVDGGAFDGSTTKCFLNCLMSKLNKEGFAFVCEPEEAFSNSISETLKNYENKYELLRKGLWNETAILSFRQDNVSSRIDVTGKESVEVDAIDNMIKEPVSFIKMDIEGAEYEALCGAKNSIKKYLPRLAISVYHKKEDIIRLPQLVLKLGEYDLYLRHYTLTEGDTVLYALPRRK